MDRQELRFPYKSTEQMVTKHGRETKMVNHRMEKLNNGSMTGFVCVYNKIIINS